MAVKPHEVRKGDTDHPGPADPLHPRRGGTIPHAPSTRDAAVLPQSSDGETLVEGPAGSDVGPRTPAGHIWDSSGTPASTPAPQRGQAVQAGQPARDCALRRRHFSARMPGARVLLLVQHVTTSLSEDGKGQRSGAKLGPVKRDTPGRSPGDQQTGWTSH